MYLLHVPLCQALGQGVGITKIINKTDYAFRSCQSNSVRWGAQGRGIEKVTKTANRATNKTLQ